MVSYFKQSLYNIIWKAIRRPMTMSTKTGHRYTEALVKLTVVDVK